MDIDEYVLPCLCFKHAEENLAEMCEDFVMNDTREQDQKRADHPKRGEPGWLDDARIQFLEVIDYEESRLKDHLKSTEEIEKFEIERRMASSNLPPKEAAERILRYETTVERQFYRAVNQLERMQRQRRGDVVPPPVTVDVTTER